MDITVYLLDDDDKFCNYLKSFLIPLGYNVVHFHRAHYFLEHYNINVSACLILDVQLPSMSGLELQELLIKHRLHVPIIFISEQADVVTAVQAMKNGAIDFLIKPINQQKLIEDINTALKIDKAYRDKRNSHSQFQNCIRKLTPREHQVYELMLNCKSIKDISFNLGISTSTVEQHRTSIFYKLGVQSHAELIFVTLNSKINEETY